MKLLKEDSFQRGQKFWITGGNFTHPELVTVSSKDSDENGSFMDVKSMSGRVSTIYDSDLPKYQISFEKPTPPQVQKAKVQNPTVISTAQFEKKIKQMATMSDGDELDFSVASDLAENLLHDNEILKYLIYKKKITKKNRALEFLTDMISNYA
jgi:hypothetical protein